MTTPTLVTLLCVLALGSATAVMYSQNQALEERLDALAAQTEALETGSPAPGGPALGAPTAERDIALLNEEMASLGNRVRATEERVAARGPAEGASAPIDMGALDESVRDIVLDMAGDVRFRTKLGLTGSPNLPKKPAFGQLADVLKLDATQEDAFRRDLGELQQDVFALLSEERDDGVIPLEEIAKAEELSPGDPGRAQIFIKLFTMKIPGSEETYMNRVVEWTTDMRRRTSKYLRADQTEIFNAIDVDLLGVKLDG